ncbi:hypothetical protein AW168_21030 [Nocardia brasiliensis]|nr:hypothetical protein [Nocardia brasiliensis]OCF88192.1 hypothetical protein AW168_21030 [Nocardia brasiliensis]
MRTETTSAAKGIATVARRMVRTVAEWQRPVIEAAKIGRLPAAEFVTPRDTANTVDPDADDLPVARTAG